jgi:acetylornithine/N-succinyldiaminopimelate aminotransferase
VRAQGEYLRAQLRNISEEFQLGEVRGQGLLVAVEIPQQNSNAIADAAFARGLLVNAPRATVLRFMPALTVTREEIDLMIELLRLALVDAGAAAQAA